MKRRGRPPLVPGERGISASTTLPRTLYDTLARESLRRHKDVSELIREIVAAKYSTDKSTSTPA